MLTRRLNLCAGDEFSCFSRSQHMHHFRPFWKDRVKWRCKRNPTLNRGEGEEICNVTQCLYFCGYSSVWIMCNHESVPHTNVLLYHVHYIIRNVFVDTAVNEPFTVPPWVFGKENAGMHLCRIRMRLPQAWSSRDGFSRSATARAPFVDVAVFFLVALQVSCDIFLRTVTNYVCFFVTVTAGCIRASDSR